MTPESVVAVLATAHLGAVHSVVFGGLSPHELAARIDDARPSVLVTARCGIGPTRVDVAGYRLCSGAMVAVIGAHPAVAECAVVGIGGRDQGAARSRGARSGAGPLSLAPDDRTSPAGPQPERQP